MDFDQLPISFSQKFVSFRTVSYRSDPAIFFRVDHDVDKRSNHFFELFRCLRFEQMSETDLSDLRNFHLVPMLQNLSHMQFANVCNKLECLSLAGLSSLV